jgi:putative sterol carrier protein
MVKFPEPEWVQTLMDKLNNDQQYARIARNWEGDLVFVIEPGGNLRETTVFYMDLWHGKCRDAYPLEDAQKVDAALTLKAPYDVFVRILGGELEAMQALLTRKISIKGNMALLMRSVPTVLDFVRCARENSVDFV